MRIYSWGRVQVGVSMWNCPGFVVLFVCCFCDGVRVSVIRDDSSWSRKWLEWN